MREYEDQKRRRQRAYLTQQAVGNCFPRPISDSAVSRYENGEELPFGFTAEDYEHALAAALVAKRRQKVGAK